MGKINDTTVYPNTTPVLTDHVPGTDVSNTTNDANGETVTFTMQAVMDLFEANFAAPASAISSGTFADARIASTNVTQHEASLTITESQISDLQSYLVNVVEDTTPQLGGNLDVNGNSLVSVTNGDIDIAPNGTGRSTIDRVQNTHVYNAQTGTAYTLVAADQDSVVTMNNASANTLTIPTNASVAFPTGTKIEIWALGAGTTTIAGDTGVTLQGNGGSVSAGSTTIQTQYGGATLTKIATDTWMVGGDIAAVA